MSRRVRRRAEKVSVLTYHTGTETNSWTEDEKEVGGPKAERQTEKEEERQRQRQREGSKWMLFN